MDDPWGSPWADETQTPQPVKLKGDDFAVKPTTPIKAASLALEQKTNSPWDDADDDGFGDWAVGTPEKGGGLELDGADDGWQSNAGSGLEYGLTVDDSPALSGTWNNLATIPADGMPKLAPSLLPKPSDIPRQPSPDPWAVNSEREDTDIATAIVPKDQDEGGNTDDEFMLDTSHKKEIATDVAAVVVDDAELLGAFANGIPTEAETILDNNEPNEPNVEVVLKPFANAEQEGNIPEAEHISSRPSSSPSDQSHHNDTAQDSPRTSLDEELKRPPTVRKVSTKVQHLVEHFDGLAKQEEAAEPVVARSGSPGRTTESVKNLDGAEDEDDEEETDDFGDFEDVQSEIEEAADEVKAVDSGKSPVIEESETTLQRPVTTSIPEKPPSHVHPRDLGPVEFTFDTKALDQLYSDVEAKPPSEKIFIPDVVPHDSFSSTEERKTWYRISRYGTMRKYNTGADENYIRVNWTQSQVRSETLKIVARWIEEDRISGRVVLGGASKGSSIFGWSDSKAAPVPLATAFAAKNGKQKSMPIASEPVADIPREWPKGLVQTRSTSGSPKSRRKSSTKVVASEDPKLKSPVANFGWNTVIPAVQNVEPQKHVHKKNLSGSISSTPEAGKITPSPQPNSNDLSSLAEPTKRAIPINGIPPRPHSIAHTSISFPPALGTSNVVNDDDDWGELVSSPSASIAPILPAPSGSLHRSTGSLGSAFPSTAPIPQLPSIYTTPLEQNFTWVNGSDEAQKSMAANSMTTNTQDTFGQHGFEMTNNHIDKNFITASPTAHQPAASDDPWASADFSFFETSTTLASKASKPSTLKPVPKSVTFAMTPISTQSQKSREEVDQDRIVKSIVKGLPDLSYMLRK